MSANKRGESPFLSFIKGNEITKSLYISQNKNDGGDVRKCQYF
jgi:hypothetical protein